MTKSGLFGLNETAEMLQRAAAFTIEGLLD
jgi:hypothetical protein